MIHRSKKIICMAMAAAVCSTCVPAIAAEVKYVDSQDGKVLSAKAYGNGIFLIDGYKNDDDNDSAIYYVDKNGKYTNMDKDGIESGDKLGDKVQGHYIEIGDNGDKFLDMNNNLSVVDDNVKDNMLDDIATKVRKKIKKDNDGRYDEEYCEDFIEAEAKSANDSGKLLNGCFGNWTHYKYKLSDSRISDKDESESYSDVYSDVDGNYIDGDYSLGKLKVSLSDQTTGASVTLKNTDDTYEIEEDGVTHVIKAEIKENEFLTEAYADLYRTADLTIYEKTKGESDDNYKNITGDVYFGGSKNKHQIKTNDDGSVTVIEKMSKEQSFDTADGIKYPKDTQIYFVTDEDGEDIHVLGLNDASKVSGAGYGFGVITSSAAGMTSFYVDLQNLKVDAESLYLKNKNGYGYVDTSEYEDADIEGTGAWALPGGDLWCLSDGRIKEWNIKEEKFDDKYKVDHSMNKISIEDADNIIVWNEDDEVYSIIYNKPQDQNNQNTATTDDNINKYGWAQNADGSWSYYNEDGSLAKGWVKSNTDNKWYNMDENGHMSSNKWLNDNGKWYYLNQDGSMASGWLNDNGKWYYLDESGKMLSNTVVNGYKLDNSGVWVG